MWQFSSWMFMVFLCAVLAPDIGVAQSEQYPTRSIRFIVPSSAAGPTDILARLFAERLTKRLGQAIVVENMAGAGGNIGVQTVARSAPDGYTVMIGAQNLLVLNPLLYRDLPFDVEKDFAAVALLVRVPYMLVVHPGVPAANLKDLLAVLKSRPGYFNYASSNGYGSTAHIGGELLKRAGQVDIRHVPYKGAAPAISDLLGGQVHLLFSIPGPVIPHLASGRLKAIAIAAPRRSGLLPEVPTFEEAGLPGFDVSSWYNMMTRAGVSTAIVTRLNQELNRMLQMPDLRAQLLKLNAEPAGGSANEHEAYLQSERVKWSAIIKDANITIENN